MLANIKEAWKKIKDKPSIIFFGATVGLSIELLQILSSFITAHSYFFTPVTEHQGWILVKINGFGYTMYQDSINFANLQPFKYNYLSRSSKIITMIYTSAGITPPGIGDETSNGGTIEKDVSVLTNRDDETTIKDTTKTFKKINSQTYQSQLVSFKESGLPVCLYVKGFRNGESSSYLNILKIRAVIAIDKKVNMKSINLNLLKPDEISKMCNTESVYLLK
jgi:hypothetical protein